MRDSRAAAGHSEATSGLGPYRIESAVGSPSSSGLGHRPFKAAARVRTPLGTQDKTASARSNTSHPSVRRQRQHELRERAGSETAAAAPDVAAPHLLGSLVVWCRSVSRTAAGQTRADSSGPGLDLQSLALPQQVARRKLGVRAHCAHCYLILRAGERWQQLLVLKRFESQTNGCTPVTKRRFPEPEGRRS